MFPPARLSFTLVACLLLAPAASAPELCLKAEKRQGRLYVEAWFDNDTPAEGAKVKVLREGQTVLEGTTDERGVWTAECPPSGSYRLYATDGGGHKKEIPFVIDESSEPQRAGETKEEVSQRHLTGTVMALAVVAVL